MLAHMKAWDLSYDVMVKDVSVIEVLLAVGAQCV
jgi:hypothetical protein